jgi:lysophospholipase L1-like esterase
MSFIGNANFDTPQADGGGTLASELSVLHRPAILRTSAVQRLVSQATGGIPAGRTIGCLHQVPATTIGIQFEFANSAIGSPTVYNAAFAISAGVSDFCNPINAAGTIDNTLWVPITVGGSTTISVPAAAAALTQIGRTVSDMMPLTSAPLARTDGGSGILVFFRQFGVSGTHTVCSFDGTVPAVNGFANGVNPGQFSQTLGAGWAAIANVAVAGSFGSSNLYTGNAFQCIVPHAIMPAVAGPVLTIMSVGDSILSGVGSKGIPKDSGVDGIGLQLTKLLTTAARPVLHRNGAVSGMASTDYTADATLALAASVPDVMLLQCFSANDIGGPTTSTAWAAFQRCMALANKASALGSRVLIVMSPPFSGYTGNGYLTATWEGPRQYANSLVRASGFPFVDSDAVAGNGAVPPTYLAAASDDHVHPNDFGASLIAAAAAQVLKTSYGIF